MLRYFVCLTLLLGMACTKKPDAGATQDTLTRRQRDSAIGASQLPGAKGVQRALDEADSAAARNAGIDSLGASLP